MKIIVKKKAQESLKRLFPWVYKSDIIIKNKVENGSIVSAFSQDGKFLAKGYINLNSQIAFRALSFKNEEIDLEFFIKRFKEALRLRESINSNSYRVIHSEADYLSGLIVDRYGDYFSILLNSLGMIKQKELIVQAIKKLFNPKGIYLNSSPEILKKENATFKPYIIGEIPSTFEIIEDQIRYRVDIINGQKSGFYLDQRKNRKIVASYVKKEDKVLDLFSNIGGFGLYAAKKGAKVIEVDISKEAIKKAQENFQLNNLQGKFINENVFDYLRVVRKEKEKYDLIIIDPPSFAKNRSQIEGAKRGFKDLMVNSLKIVK
ncbi:MAG: class I SAM-dependent rRNA methyltransferase, partial [Epsilonproteobacteria bacterium]|nr:class I SAM-dependent rRNA methyltransferase [Campylobacterota bacterium]